MPRQERGHGGERFELGGYWLGREQSGGSVYRYWYDQRTGRVSRRSLGTKDFEEAKRLLASVVVSRPRHDPDPTALPEPRSVLMAAVLDHYLENRAKKLPSYQPARRAVELLTEFLFEVRKLPVTAKADSFGLDLQEGFVAWSASLGHSSKYISRNLSVVAAALNFAAEEHTIEDPDDGRRIVRLMSSAPKIRYDPEWIAREGEIAAPQRREWVPTLEQMGRWIDCIRSEHMFRYVIIGLNTWARAEAVMELDFKRQIDLDHGLVDLNPPGRPQNIKRRPIVRLTENLRTWAAAWKVARPMVYRGGAVEDLKKAFQNTNYRWLLIEAGVPGPEVERLMSKGNERIRAVAIDLVESGKTADQLTPLLAAGIDVARAAVPASPKGPARRVTRRVIRSFMSTRVRAQREVKVDREQRQVWLGHTAQDTTSNYEIMDPDYLRECAAATDYVIGRIGLCCRRSLWPEDVQPELPLGRPPRPRSGSLL